MNIGLAAVVVAGLLLTAVWLGRRIQCLLPENHLGSDTKDTVKVATGLVATMSALVLGLLVSSAKSSYDTARAEVIQMAAKISFLDRVLAAYGPDTASLRVQFRAAVERSVGEMWSNPETDVHQLASRTSAGDAFYVAIHSLPAKTDLQHTLKTQALSLAVELAQVRTLLLAQLVPSISLRLLSVVVGWLFVIFLSFGLLAPSNGTAVLSLTIAALSVSGAIFLILELDRPLSGYVAISREPILNALNHTSGK